MKKQLFDWGQIKSCKLSSSNLFYEYNIKFQLFFFVTGNSLKGIRAKVWQGRMDSSLFDANKYATDLERLYGKMWDRLEAGQGPDHITDFNPLYIHKLCNDEPVDVVFI